MFFSAKHPLALIGCGQMGQALALGWRRDLLDTASLLVLDRSPDKRGDFYARAGAISHVPSLGALAQSATPAALCLAVKPHQLETLLPEIHAAFVVQKPLIMTVIAGKDTAYYQRHLWKDAAIIRVMPNTPSQIGLGMSGCFANATVTPEQRSAADELMKAVGETLWLEDESQMHALTAVSGSGPAYVFYLMEMFIDAAIHEGFTPQQARQLVEQTFIGAAQMAQSSGEDITRLRHNVTSPGGTTQAGLDVLMQRGFEQIAKETLAAAKSRSETLMAAS